MKKAIKIVGYILAACFAFGLFDKSVEAGTIWISALLISHFLGRIGSALEAKQ